MKDPDFSGWATKANLKCSDGRTIMPDAFAHMDGMKVPLVWQHRHNETENVLGHAILTAKPEGMWADAYFNETPAGQHAKLSVEHGDLDMLSIWANNLVEKSKSVFHGMIREVSLVLSGANPGARIENVRIAHSEFDIEEIADEAIIYTGELIHSADGKPAGAEEGAKESEKESTKESETGNEGEKQTEGAQEGVETDADQRQAVYDSLSDEQKEFVHSMLENALEVAESGESNLGAVVQHAVPDDASIQDVLGTFNEDQMNVLNYMLGAVAQMAAEGNTAAHSGINNQEGNDMSRNLFEQNGVKADEGKTLSHDDLQIIQSNAQKVGSYKEAFLAHAESLGYGIDDIELLFPDAKSVTSQPELIARRTEWVKDVLDAAKHSPFSRIKSLAADLTADEARAKGYVKGNLKKDEVIKLLKRVTTPTTVYKKQKLDRDDIVDITDLDVVSWLKWEMRFMLEEELARAILVGDGREPDDEDKIDEEKLRPIAWDNEMYAHPVTVPSNTTPDGIVESVLRARKFYKGTGTPTFFTTDDVLTDMLLIKDKVNRRVYNTEAELAAALRVKEIVVVEVMEDTPDLLGIMVNMADYTIGADKGGQMAFFEDFDIDYNQHKYLKETRISGALTKAKSAVVVKRTSGTTVTPLAPAFDQATNTLTVPTVAGVSYFDVTDINNDVELADGSNVVITQTTDVEARADAGYNFPHNTDADWTFAYIA